MTRQRFVYLVPFVLVLLLLAACGGSPTATPTPPRPRATAVRALPTQPAAPTALSTAPTTAPDQPTSADTTPSAGTADNPLADALAKVKSAAAYRVTMTISGRGDFTVAGAATPAPSSPDQDVPLISMQGEVNGQDSHFALQGFVNSFLGLDATSTLEITTANGNVYIKGPVPMLGATEAKWYVLPAQAANALQPPLTPEMFLQSFGEAGIDPADFQQAPDESLDNQSCQVYSGNKDAIANAFARLGGAAGSSQEDLDSIDSAEFKFWICQDGYLHQIRMVIEGHAKNQPQSKGAFSVMMRISDFDTDIQIQPPEGATPITLPQPGATATP